MIRLRYVNCPVPSRDDCDVCGGTGISETAVFTASPRAGVRDRVCGCVAEWVRGRGELCCGGLGWQVDADGFMFACGVCQGTGETVWDV